MKKLMFTGICIASIFTFSMIDRDKEMKERESEAKANTIVLPDSITNIRRYNFETSSWDTYSDEEIRIMREKQSYKSDGGYIYTPGRHVPTREEEIRDYIDENIDEILDEYQN